MARMSSVVISISPGWFLAVAADFADMPIATLFDWLALVCKRAQIQCRLGLRLADVTIGPPRFACIRAASAPIVRFETGATTRLGTISNP